MDKRYVIAGLSILAALIIYNSTKKVEVKDVIDPSDINTKNFDSSTLPSKLQPPYRMAEGEVVNTAKKKSLTGISFKPRFDFH
jgi:hypothetical protein